MSSEWHSVSWEKPDGKQGYRSFRKAGHFEAASAFVEELYKSGAVDVNFCENCGDSTLGFYDRELKFHELG